MKKMHLRRCVRNRHFLEGSFAYGCSVERATTLEEQAVCQGTHLQRVSTLSITVSASYSTQRLSRGGSRDTRASGILCTDWPWLYPFSFQ